MGTCFLASSEVMEEKQEPAAVNDETDIGMEIDSEVESTDTDSDSDVYGTANEDETPPCVTSSYSTREDAPLLANGVCVTPMIRRCVRPLQRSVGMNLDGSYPERAEWSAFPSRQEKELIEPLDDALLETPEQKSVSPDEDVVHLSVYRCACGRPGANGRNTVVRRDLGH